MREASTSPAPRRSRCPSFGSPPPPPRPCGLQRAIQSGNAAEIRRLSKADAGSLRVPLSGADLPLHYAVKTGCSTAVLEALLEGGACVTDQGTAGESILYMMMKSDMAKKDDEPPFPMFAFLDLSARHGLHAAPFPLPPFVNNLKEMWEEEPVTTDVEDQLISIASCLLDFGADPLQEEADGKSAANLAEQGSRPRLASLLRHHGDRQVAKAVQQQRLLERLPVDVERHALGFLIPEGW